MKPILIVGAGLAGYTVARELRKLDKISSIIIVTADNGGFYSKPMLSNAFAQNKSARQLLNQSAEQMATQLNASVLASTRVLDIDGQHKSITTSAGKFEYGKLVIAVGATPIRLSLGGDAADQVLSINHLNDYDVFRTRLADKDSSAGIGRSRIAILGAGLIGCEFADDLSGAGYTVTLIDPNPLPLAALAPPPLSQSLAAALAARHVTLRLGTVAEQINQTDDGLEVHLSDHSRVTVDLVLSAVGLRPDLTLAQVAKLATARGIVVDAFGQTSVPDIYALGDCAEYACEPNANTRTLPYIAPLMTAARAIARTLSGTATKIDWTPMPVIVKTPCHPLTLLPPPSHTLASGTWRTTRHGATTVSRFYDAQGLLTGFGVAPNEANVRQQLLAELGQSGNASLLPV